ncbi:basigin isoform X2 [Diprion similis]|uniref:basigin isoform X2 n=1 Tax=Diprion similis TaxID=362088 RepID=UPI001EF97078|nr:basigin isoform X2 [Diprion similis]
MDIEMKRQAGFLLALLFLANFLTIQADSDTEIPKTPLPPPVSGDISKGLSANQSELIYAFTEKYLVLPCNVASGTPRDNITWTHNNATLKETETLKFSADKTKLNITKGYEENMGHYTCSAGSGMSTQIMKVVPHPIVKLPSPDTNVVEGEKLRLTCEVTPELGAEVNWIFVNTTYTKSTERVNITSDGKSSTFTVSQIQQDDRGNVTCSVVFARTSNNFTFEMKTFLRVTNKFAALWPFLGICAEVIVLCAIILVYEKKRNKAELEESDTDQSPDTKPTPNKGSEVRQRK